MGTPKFSHSLFTGSTDTRVFGLSATYPARCPVFWGILLHFFPGWWWAWVAHVTCVINIFKLISGKQVICMISWQRKRLEEAKKLLFEQGGGTILAISFCSLLCGERKTTKVWNVWHVIMHKWIRGNKGTGQSVGEAHRLWRGQNARIIFDSMWEFPQRKNSKALGISIQFPLNLKIGVCIFHIFCACCIFLAKKAHRTSHVLYLKNFQDFFVSCLPFLTCFLQIHFYGPKIFGSISNFF